MNDDSQPHILHLAPTIQPFPLKPIRFDIKSPYRIWSAQKCWFALSGRAFRLLNRAGGNVRNAKMVFLMALFLVPALPAAAQNVKITALGSHDGELCPFDRALIFEDPDGTRILYDAGFTVRGPEDPRLGKIDGVLLSHVHSDHIGPAHSSVANAGDCGQPKFDIKDAPSSNTEKIVVAKKAKFFVGGEMNSWFGKRIPAAG